MAKQTPLPVASDEDINRLIEVVADLKEFIDVYFINPDGKE
jgi:hypothetical protein